MLSFNSKKILLNMSSSSTRRLALINNQLRTMATSAPISTESQEVEFHVKGTSRIVSLNRPSKLNALNTSMCKEITPRLIEYSKSNSNNLIILKSNSEKAFCSGGDVIQCAKYNLNKEPLKSVEFFENEYNLNYLLSIYNKPIVSLVNGIVMGGGVGLSVHTPFRIVSETTRFAMPESNIGFFSDVGTSFWLPKLDGNLGYYLALTGDELNSYDCLIAGFGTHYIPTNKYEELIERLSSLSLQNLSIDRRNDLFDSKDEFYSIVNDSIEEFTEQIPSNHKFKFNNDELNIIEECFNPIKNKKVINIIDSLLENGSDFALKIAKDLNSKSQISLELTYQLLQKNSKNSIHSSLTNELKLASKMMVNYKQNDFNEFISTNLINRKETIANNLKPKASFSELSKIPESLIEDLISTDVYNPDESSFENLKTEEIIEVLDKLKIDNFTSDDLSLRKDFNSYPYNNGLPTQSEIENYIKGNDSSNRKYSVTKDEAIKYFDMKYKNKNGVYFKVNQTLNRKCKPSEYGEDYLEWIE